MLEEKGESVVMPFNEQSSKPSSPLLQACTCEDMLVFEMIAIGKPVNQAIVIESAYICDLTCASVIVADKNKRVSIGRLCLYFAD